MDIVQTAWSLKLRISQNKIKAHSNSLVKLLNSYLLFIQKVAETKDGFFKASKKTLIATIDFRVGKREREREESSDKYASDLEPIKY